MISVGAIVLFSRCYFRRERECLPPSPQDISPGSWAHTCVSQHLLICLLHSMRPCIQCHGVTFTYKLLSPALHFSICMLHIIHIRGVSEGNNFTCSQRSGNTGVCFWRLDICTAGAGIAYLKRKAVWWSWDVTLPEGLHLQCCIWKCEMLSLLENLSGEM